MKKQLPVAFVIHPASLRIRQVPKENTYTHLGLEDAAEELRRMEEAEAARREQEKLAGKAKDSQKLFNAV